MAALAAAGLLEPAPMQGFTLWAPLRQTVTFGDETAALLSDAPGRHGVELSGTRHLAERRADGWWIDGAKSTVRPVRLPGVVAVFSDRAWEFTLPDALARGTAAGAGGNLVEAPMPGLVKSVFAHPGDVVAAGDRLAVLEAMKMEHTLNAPRDGVVAEVLVAPGSQVEAGAALIRLEDEG
jgi:3-methylcrotonyl-CoA carboxylase alpha subunit